MLFILSKINIYLILTLFAVVLFYIINESIFGFNYNDMFSDINLNKTILDDKSKHHRLMEGVFHYAGTILFGIIFFLIEKLCNKKKVEIKEKSNLDKSLIYYDQSHMTKKQIFQLILIIVL